MSRVDSWTAQIDRFYAWREPIGNGPGGVAALIAERPVSIVIVRAAGMLAPQTVRIDLDTRLMNTERMGTGVSSSLTSKQRVILMGYKNYEGANDTDIAFGDTFLYDGQQFVVGKVEMGFTDRLLAEATGEG